MPNQKNIVRVETSNLSRRTADVTLTGSQRYQICGLVADRSAMGQVETVSKRMPRIVDAMNSYLRAVNPEEFEQDVGLAETALALLRRYNLSSVKPTRPSSCHGVCPN